MRSMMLLNDLNGRQGKACHFVKELSKCVSCVAVISNVIVMYDLT